jgi:diguanylate cyclase (GGDEF)-like protein/PAS domain S-box-containing protein
MQVNTKQSSLIRHKIILWLLTGSILLIGSLITYKLWSNAQHDNLQKLHTALEESADVTVNNLRARFSAILVIMRGVKGFIDASDTIEPEEFHTYIKSLNLGDKFGVRGIALVELIDDAAIKPHISHISKKDLSNFRIRPAGKRPFYAPITLIEPLDDLNIRALGLDVLTLPTARSALEQARDANEVRISKRMTLAQDADKKDQHSFVMYLPIYKKNTLLNSLEARRQAVIGWVDVPFRMTDLMNGFKGEIDDDVAIKIYEGLEATPDTFLYHSPHDQATEQVVLTQRVLDIGSSQWTLLFQSTPAFEARIIPYGKSTLIALLGSTLTILSAFLAWFLLNSRQRAENRYQKLFDQASDGVLVLNYEHRFIAANLSAMKMLGYQRNALINMQLQDVLVANVAESPEFITNLMSDHLIKEEWDYRRNDGTRFVAEVNCRKLDKNYYFAIIRDLTEQKLAEHRIRHLTQLYQALSEVNQAIVRMSDDNELFSIVCRCSVNFGGMKMAWVGQLDEQSQQILPVAVYGDGIDYVDGLVVSASANVPEGRGPTGSALRENEIIIINNFQTNPITSIWHNKAKTFGWGSSVSIPIQRDQKPFAVLNVYHENINSFDDEAIALLQEMAGDISFALDNFDREAKKQKLILDLNYAHKHINQIVNLSPAVIYTLKINANNSFTIDFISENVYQMTGYPKDKWVQHNFWINHIYAEDLAGVLAAQETLFEMGSLNHQYRFNHANGTQIWIEDQLMLIQDDDGKPSEIVGAWLDITERLQAEEKLRINAKVFESSREGILITNEKNEIISVNRAFTEITGYDADEAIGKNPNMLVSGNLTPNFYDAMWANIGTTGYWQGEVINRRKNGDLYTQWLSISTIKGLNGKVSQHIGIITDISERKIAEERIQFLSNFDPLTNLPNRNLLNDRTTLALAATKRLKNTVTLMYLDLDRFKFINESLGPTIGDQVLKELAQRLLDCVRPEDTVCRQGGDEFIILLPNTDAEGAAHVAKKLLFAIAQPFNFNGQRIVLTTSIGIAAYPQDGHNFEQLAQSADAALYRAKHEGRNNFQFFARQMHEQANDVLQLENELRNAIEHEEFLLYYQPQYDSKLSKIVGLEALIRWQHPEKGLVSPAVFIPIAEESGLIAEIGDWVLRTAVKQLATWQQAGLNVVPIAVNLSVVQFHQDTLYDSVCQILRETKVDPSMLELELTEGIAMEDSERTLNVLNQLNALGVKLSIDDFGTGYSSLSYLKKFKIDKLKIDQSFVRGLGVHPQDAAIITAIISMAKSLGFKTIAEGVETQEQLNFLIQYECDEIQGYYFSKPLPSNEVAKLMSK